MAACEQDIARVLSTLNALVALDAPPLPPPTPAQQRPQRHEPAFDLRVPLSRLTGVDLSHVPGFQALAIHTVRSEVGRDMHTWPHEGFQELLLSRSQDQRSLTAPESRAMQRGTGRGTEVCYNVPTAVDAKPKLMVACEVTNAPGDRDWPSPMALQAQAGRDCGFDVVAAVGYSHGHEVKTCLEAGITPSVPRPIPSANEQRGLFSKEDCIDDKATDTSQCPAGARRTFRFDTVEVGRHIRSEAPPAGGGCARKPQCTRRKGGRRRTRGVEEQRLEEMEQRVRRRPAVMKRRKAWVEHPCGTMKRGWEHGSCLMRGLEQVWTECSLTVWAYKLRRVLNRVEMPRLRAALG